MNEEVFSRYDAADGLKTEKDITAFLEAADEEGENDPAFMARVFDVVTRARKRIGRPKDWNGQFDAIKAGGVPDDFLSPSERSQAQNPARCQAHRGKSPGYGRASP